MQQNIRMFPHRTGLFLQSPLRILCLLVFHLLLTNYCRGQSQLIGPSQPIVATVGHDIILPCHLEPAVDVAHMILEWTRPDLNPIFVYVRRFGEEVPETKHPAYKDRTSVSVSELKNGNISLKLTDVKPSDEGTYQCYIPKLNKGSSVQLVVDDFFELQSSSSALTVGLTVSLTVCILIILILVFLFCRQNTNKTKGSNRSETGGVKKNVSTSETEDQFDTKKGESLLLRRDDSENDMWETRGHMEKKTYDQLQEDHQRREEAEKRVKQLEEELKEMKNQAEDKQAELLQLHEEKLKNQEELKNLKEQLENMKEQLENLEEQLENKNKEWKQNKKELEEARPQLDSKNEEISRLKTQVESLTADIKNVTEEKRKKERECQELQAELDAKKEPAKDFWHETEKDGLMKDKKELEQKNQILERRLTQTKRELDHQLKKNAETSQIQNQSQGDILTAEVKTLTEENQSSENNQQLQKQLENEKKEETNELESKNEENSQLKTQVQEESQEADAEKLTEEKPSSEVEQQQPQNELETKKKEEPQEQDNATSDTQEP